MKCVACNVGRILETMNKSNKILVMQAMVISGSLALVDRGVLKHDEAVIHYRCHHIFYPLQVPPHSLAATYLRLGQKFWLRIISNSINSIATTELLRLIFVQKHLCKNLESLLTSLSRPGIIGLFVNLNLLLNNILIITGVGGS